LYPTACLEILGTGEISCICSDLLTVLQSATRRSWRQHLSWRYAGAHRVALTTTQSFQDWDNSTSGWSRRRPHDHNNYFNLPMKACCLGPGFCYCQRYRPILCTKRDSVFSRWY
jgi:hypothetical protein